MKLQVLSLEEAMDVLEAGTVTEHHDLRSVMVTIAKDDEGRFAVVQGAVGPTFILRPKDLNDVLDDVPFATTDDYDLAAGMPIALSFEEEEVLQAGLAEAVRAVLAASAKECAGQGAGSARLRKLPRRAKP